MQYHKLRYLFEWNGGSGGYESLFNGQDEAINFRDMLLFIFKVKVYTYSSHLPAYRFEISVSMHTFNIEVTLQV